MSALLQETRTSLRGVLFDLFQTLVFFDGSKIPRVRMGEHERPVTIDDLDGRLRALDATLDSERFFQSMGAVHREIAAHKLGTGDEVSSGERFRRVLAHALDAHADDQRIATAADQMVDEHMNTLFSAVVCPDDRRALLEALAGTYRVGLVSNFDHGPTAHRVLDEHGLAEFLEVRIVSDDIGIVKPDARIFSAACDQLGTQPEQTLFVGDSMRADIEGAHGAGLKPVWVDASGDESGPAVARVGDVRELRALLLG